MTQDEMRSRIQLRERMLGGLAALNTLRPFLNTGRDDALIEKAWEALWQEMVEATAAYVEMTRG